LRADIRQHVAGRRRRPARPPRHRDSA